MVRRERYLRLRWRACAAEPRWERAIRDEHCDVEANKPETGAWAGSDRMWTTRNYHLRTSPRLEYLWVVELSWKGDKPASIVGGYQRNADSTVRSR